VVPGTATRGRCRFGIFGWRPSRPGSSSPPALPPPLAPRTLVCQDSGEGRGEREKRVTRSWRWLRPVLSLDVWCDTSHAAAGSAAEMPPCVPFWTLAARSHEPAASGLAPRHPVAFHQPVRAGIAAVSQLGQVCRACRTADAQPSSYGWMRMLKHLKDGYSF